MKHLSKAALVVAGLALAACSQPYLDDGYQGPGAGTGEAGSVSDPTSVAHFNEAIGDRVLFAVDQSTLGEQGRLVVLAQANWLLANTEYTAVIEGHADEQGTREYNLALGARRAAAVEELLVAQGIAANRLRTVSFGKERPLEVCSQESCYERNRRAVTVLAAGLSG
ncbi:Outer membrane lipoprotein Omp16 precursor [Shimia sp. SK013]|uniref:peptidoglycan-associated lipoprotein Pal n=1 Tax=Shimia sp. SK013 TaxID=1389006 RepID=UPI0006B494B4|nr:peptidoglycan-associated lipoprotein Pal [Shimia sp. SK013]KPA20135.1 Outer membrane lipoprotein Omp16 precursor [Shimia sp. SK013]